MHKRLSRCITAKIIIKTGVLIVVAPSNSLNSFTQKLLESITVFLAKKINSDSCFRFNNPKQCSNWIILVSFCSSHLAIKLLQCLFYENLKNRCKNRFFRKKFKKVCVLQRQACTQIQNFKRNYLENYNDSEYAVKTKNAPFFMFFPNMSFFHMVVTG